MGKGVSNKGDKVGPAVLSGPRKTNGADTSNGPLRTASPTSNGFRVIEGSITAPQGFRAGAVFCDIKRLGTGKGSNKGPKCDLAILISDAPAAVAGMFTTSRVCAAPVKVSLKRAAQPSARAVVVNSGN